MTARPARCMGLVLAIWAITAFAASAARGGDLAWIYLHLQRAPLESKASGALLIRLDEQRSILQLRVRNLDPDREYLLLSNDQEQARLTTDPYGNATLQLRYPPLDGTPALDFDPRGKLLSVSDGSEDRLSAVVSGPLEPRGSLVWEVAGIEATEGAEGGQLTGSYRALPNGWRFFELRLRAVSEGAYQVLVDGEAVGEVVANAEGNGSIRFWSASQPTWFCRHRRSHGGWGFAWLGKTWARLDFEPRGARVEVVRDGEVLFAGLMRARVALPEEVDACPVVDLQVSLMPVLFFGSGEASLVSEDGGCDHEFRVTVRGLAAANYELWVGEAIVGTVPVRNWSDGLRGEVRFDTQPDDPDELSLAFDPRGEPIAIRRPVGATDVLYLEALFPTE